MECLKSGAVKEFFISSRVNLLLFGLTVITTLFAGAVQSGGNPFKDIASLRLGIPFSFTLLSILLFHEIAHYVAARVHGTASTLPYFIPAPTFLGTFGAIIRMKSPLADRKALIDVGIAGPLASFVFSIAAVSIGLFQSPIVSSVPEGSLHLGNSIIFSGMVRLINGHIPEGYDIVLNPVAFAGWIGFFVTAMNLIPVAQLDGGHIAYALLGEKHVLAARVVILILLAFGFLWLGWFVWVVLITGFGLKHPAPSDDISPVNRGRKLLGILAFGILIITFVPAPFTASGG